MTLLTIACVIEFWLIVFGVMALHNLWVETRIGPDA
jgi:hypothetical protein